MSNLEEQIESINPIYGPGRVLKAKREEYEWAIESVAQALHLSTASIKSLEEDRYDQLPGSTYVIGYWRSYARLLGIDIEETIEANKRNLQVLQPPGSGIRINQGMIHKSDHGKGLVWLLLSALILAGLGYAWKTGILDPQKILEVTRLGQGTAQVTEVVEQQLTDKLSQVPADQSAQGETAQGETASGQSAQGETILVSDKVVSTSVENEKLAPAIAQKEPDLVPASTADSAVAGSALTTAVEQPEPSAVATTTESSTSALTTSEASTAQAAAVKDVNLLVMQLKEDSWLDVRDQSGKRLIYRSGKAGELIDLRGDPPFYVYIGTPDSVKITYLNKDVPFEPHQSGLFARFKLGKVLENL